jgi:hypothetical protein
MANTAAICDSFKQDILNGVHQPGDTYMCALYTSSGTLSKSTTAYTPVGEAVDSLSSYVAGGQALTGFTTGLNTDTAYLTWNSPSWPASSLTNVTGALIYNSSRSNKSVCVLTFPASSTTDGTFTVVLPTTAGAQTVTIS